VRATNLLVAIWYAVFAAPLFFTLHEKQPARRISLRDSARAGFRQLVQTYRELPVYGEAAKLLVARLIYNDGLVTIFSFAAIYAANTFDLSTDEILVLGIATNVAAGVGAFLFGFVDDWIGAKRTIALTLILLTAGALYGAVAMTIGQFWVAALLIAAMVGPNQSASRSLLGNLIPIHKRAELFGFYAFSGKLSAVAGPFLFGLVLSTTRNYRLAMSSIVVFFVVGLALLYFVDERRGMRAAREAE
jgi:UMF1 family MFS transporter